MSASATPAATAVLATISHYFSLLQTTLSKVLLVELSVLFVGRGLLPSLFMGNTANAASNREKQFR